MRSPLPWTQLRALLATEPARVVAEQCGVHLSTVYYWRRRLAIAKPLPAGLRRVLTLVRMHPGLRMQALAYLDHTSRQNMQQAVQALEVRGLIRSTYQWRSRQCWPVGEGV